MELKINQTNKMRPIIESIMSSYLRELTSKEKDGGLYNYLCYPRQPPLPLCPSHFRGSEFGVSANTVLVFSAISTEKQPFQWLSRL